MSVLAASFIQNSFNSGLLMVYLWTGHFSSSFSFRLCSGLWLGCLKKTLTILFNHSTCVLRVIVLLHDLIAFYKQKFWQFFFANHPQLKASPTKTSPNHDATTTIAYLQPSHLSWWSVVHCRCAAGTFCPCCLASWLLQASFWASTDF